MRGPAIPAVTLAVLMSIVNCDADAGSTGARDAGVGDPRRGGAPTGTSNVVLATSPHANATNIEVRQERILAIRSARILAPTGTVRDEPPSKAGSIEAVLVAAKF